MSTGCIAIISQKGHKSYFTIWDSKFGTLQLEKTVYDGSVLDVPDMKSVRSYSLQTACSEVHGSVLTLSTIFNIPKSTSYTSQFHIIPYHSPKMSLLSALGKLSTNEPKFDQASFQGQLASIIPVPPPPSTERHKSLKVWKSKVCEWNLLDETFLEELLDATKTTTVVEFQGKFVEWIATKHASLRNWKVDVAKFKKGRADGNSQSLTHFPRSELSFKAMDSLMKRCFSNPNSFWPRAVVDYLLFTGGVSSSMGSGNVGANLVQSLIAMEEIPLLEKCFQYVTDLDERDYVTILKYIATTDELSPVPEKCSAWWSKKEEEKKKREAKENPYSTARKASNIIKKNALLPTPNTFGIHLNQGQKELIKYCFSSPRVDSVFSKELGSLTQTQLHTVFEWLRSILAPQFDESLSNRHPNQKFPLWWLWYDQPQEETFKAVLDKEYDTWITVRHNRLSHNRLLMLFLLF